MSPHVSFHGFKILMISHSPILNCVLVTGRLLKSAFHARLVAAVADSSFMDGQQIDQQQSFTPKMMSPGSPRRRKSTNEIREIQQQQQGIGRLFRTQIST